MLRYAIAASAALMLVAGVASAEPVGPTTIRQTDHGTMIKKHYINHRGQMVTKRTFVHGNTVMQSRIIHAR